MFRLVIWKQVVDYDYSVIDGYEVSNKGEVRSKDRTRKNKSNSIAFQQGKILSPYTKKGTNYKRVSIRKNNTSVKYYVHTLVALAFQDICGCYRDGLTVDHKNGIQDDNRPENLWWCSINDNIHNPNTFTNRVTTSIKNLKNANTPEGRKKMGLAKRKPVMCINTGNIYSCRMEAAKDTGCNPHSIWRCCAGRSKKTNSGLMWQYV